MISLAYDINDVKSHSTSVPDGIHERFFRDTIPITLQL